MDFKVHTSSLKNKMIYDVRMFQETKCAICKKILAPGGGEPCLQVIKDFGMKCLQEAWKTHWVNWKDSFGNTCGNDDATFLSVRYGEMVLTSLC